jgi:hypothetical protein
MILLSEADTDTRGNPGDVVQLRAIVITQRLTGIATDEGRRQKRREKEATASTHLVILELKSGSKGKGAFMVVHMSLNDAGLYLRVTGGKATA